MNKIIDRWQETERDKGEEGERKGRQSNVVENHLKFGIYFSKMNVSIMYEKHTLIKD